MSKKPVPSKTKQQRANRKPTSVVVLFGLEDGTPRGARFPDDNQFVLAKAALTLGMRVGVATKPSHFEIVHKLPVGRLGSSGPNAMPKISKDLYDQLNALVGGDVGRILAKPPKSIDELASGHVVLAQDSIVDGYFEAIVLKRASERLILRWRDYPDVPPFERTVDGVGLFSGS